MSAVLLVVSRLESESHGELKMSRRKLCVHSLIFRGFMSESCKQPESQWNWHSRHVAGDAQTHTVSALLTMPDIHMYSDF